MMVWLTVLCVWVLIGAIAQTDRFIDGVAETAQLFAMRLPWHAMFVLAATVVVLIAWPIVVILDACEPDD